MDVNAALGRVRPRDDPSPKSDANPSGVNGGAFVAFVVVVSAGFSSAPRKHVTAAWPFQPFHLRAFLMAPDASLYNTGQRFADRAYTRTFSIHSAHHRDKWAFVLLSHRVARSSFHAVNRMLYVHTCFGAVHVRVGLCILSRPVGTFFLTYYLSRCGLKNLKNGEFK